MKTDIYEPWDFNNAIPKSFGLIKVNTINYQKIKNLKRVDVIYHDATDTLLFGDNMVVIDDSIADDIAMYREDFLPPEPPKTELYVPFIETLIEPIKLTDLPMP